MCVFWKRSKYTHRTGQGAFVVPFLHHAFTVQNAVLTFGSKPDKERMVTEMGHIVLDLIKLSKTIAAAGRDEHTVPGHVNQQTNTIQLGFHPTVRVELD